MDARAFATLADLVRRRAGIALTPDKAHSIIRRLAPAERMFGFKDSATLLAELTHPNEELARVVTEAIMTQDTSFFRDPAVFAHFEKIILPALTAARDDRKYLRIWSAGCSTGQEAYSLAMLWEESGLAAKGWNIDLIATDFSGDAIARAKDGVYSPYEIQRGLPASSRARHFVEEGDGWRASERLRRTVLFRPFNLLDHFGWLGELDVIFCRNVLMYLAPEEKAAVMAKLATALATDGRLVLGGAEGGAGGPPPFVPVRDARGVFLKG